MPVTVSEPSSAGRKVFFIRPPSVIQQALVETLVQAEFDVGLVLDHTKTEALLRRHPDCIAFLNIDEGWAFDQWDEFITRARGDARLSTVRLGIMTYNESAELAKHYLMDLELPAGFVKLTLGLAVSTAIILKVLEANEARGKRQFLRVPCPDERTTITIARPKGSVSGHVRDLSIAGLSCTLEEDPGIKARTPLRELRVRLQGTPLTFSGVLMGSRRDARGQMVYVIMFQPASQAAHKDRVRTFLQSTLQRQLEAEVRSL